VNEGEGDFNRLKGLASPAQIAPSTTSIRCKQRNTNAVFLGPVASHQRLDARPGGRIPDACDRVLLQRGYSDYARGTALALISRRTRATRWANATSGSHYCNRSGPQRVEPARLSR